MRWSIKSPDERGRLPGEGSASSTAFHTSPQTGVIQPKTPSWGPGAAPARSACLPALRHWAGDDLGWPGLHWLILNRQKCVWLTFVLLMFHSVVFFLTMATLTSRQNTYFSSRSHRCCHAQWVILVDRACSFQVEVLPSPTRYHLQSFLSKEGFLCVNTEFQPMAKKKWSFSGNCSISSTVRDINVISHN